MAEVRNAFPYPDMRIVRDYEDVIVAEYPGSSARYLYHYTTYQTPLHGRSKEGWLSAGRYHEDADSGKLYDEVGRHIADSLDELVLKVQRRGV